MCISPIYVNRNFVPCGKCNLCLAARRADWTFRIRQELKDSISAFFLTLTYDDSSIPFSPSGNPTLLKEDYQKFMKRLRKLSKNTLRYYCVGEYGTVTNRPHYHALIFNLEPTVDVHRVWSKGHVVRGTVTPASIHYVTKYVINRYGDYGDVCPPFALISKRSGELVNDILSMLRCIRQNHFGLYKSMDFANVYLGFILTRFFQSLSVNV